MIGYKDEYGVFINKKDFEPRKDHFTLPNLEKQHKIRMGMMWQARKMKDKIEHFIRGKTYVKVPQGVMSGPISHLIEDRSPSIDFIHPKLKDLPKEEVDIELRDMQIKALEELIKKPVGLLHASTGTGKTYMLSRLISTFNQRTLIVCSGLPLMSQMFYDIEKFFGVRCKTISGKKSMGDYDGIVIANIDSLSKQGWEFLRGFGMILLDEVDRYLQAPNRLKMVFAMSPKYMYGMTGTIKLNNVDSAVFPMYLGKKSELILKNFHPNVHVVYTDFFFDGELDDMKKFHVLKDLLYTDEDRNKKIIDTVTSTINNRKGILFSEYIEHAKLLRDEFIKRGIKTFMIIGDISEIERTQIKEELKSHKGQCLLIGSVKCVGRGFNVPELSVGYLTVCEKFQSNIEQYVGRIIRQFEGKTEADWYDFTDTMPSILKNQARHRRTTYTREFPKSKILYH